VVLVAVFVFVVVVAPGDVAALGSGNAGVGVIKPVNEHATCTGCDPKAIAQGRRTASNTFTIFVPVPGKRRSKPASGSR
jgi:hypothetical protein